MKKRGLAQALSANSAVRPMADVEHGSKTAAYRLKQLSVDIETMLAPFLISLPVLNEELKALAVQREKIIEDASRGASRITQQDRVFMLMQRPDYIEKLDTDMLRAAKQLRHLLRMLTKLKTTFVEEKSALKKDWMREKMSLLLNTQHEPTISMQFNTAEGLLRLPSDIKRFQRLIPVEEGAVGAQPVSAERRAKLTPKPKTKVRAKRAKLTIAATVEAQPEVPANLIVPPAPEAPVQDSVGEF